MEPRDPFELCGVTIDGKYRVASVVGDGGFGVVYRGVHKGFGELIAIKCLKLPAALDAAAQAELLEKLQEEGRLLHRLSKATSGIVQALDVGAFTTQSGTWVPYLVMEWLDGETLAEFLKQRALDATAASQPGGMSLAEAVALLEPAAKALAVAHAQKIAHRDVKPANIFITKVGDTRTTKILDFGIAKVLSDHRGYTTALESTAMAPTAFTPRYGAPEQFNKQRGATGPWTDVFALALVLVECVTGQKALEGDDPTQLYIASADPALRPTLRARGYDVPDSVEDVLRKALEVEPKNRFADAGVFWSTLEKALLAAGIEATGAPPRAEGKRPARALDLGSSEHVDTEQFAAQQRLRAPTESASARSAFGPTMPVESLKPDKPSSKSRTTRSASDPMEETPEGQRRSATTARAGAAPEEPSGRGSLIWTGLAVAVFAGGGVFAYTTLVKPPAPAPSASVASSAPSASASARKSAPVKSATASASVSASASAAPSAQPVVSASASPSASADAGPNGPPEVAKEGMALVEAGTVKLADPTGDVKVAAFYIDQSEVTVRRYLKCQRAKACTAAEKPLDVDAEEVTRWSSRCNGARKGATDHPMNCVTFAQAAEFCKWEGKRLPSEAEWELAARGSSGLTYPWGNSEPACTRACYDKNAGCLDQAKEIATCPVATFNDDRTERDVFDMAGNVSEWVSSGERVTRGGNFWLGAEALVTSFRTPRATGYAHPTVGFRCAADGPP